MTALRVFLDDVRSAPEGWVLVRTAWEAIAALEAGGVTHISLDHDLGDDLVNGTGYTVACWIEEAVALRGYVPPEITIHSANVVGRQRISRAIESIERLVAQRLRKNMPSHPAAVVHIPHASLIVPPDVAADLLLTPEQLTHELLVMTDRYTDELFRLPPDLATTVAFPASRLVVDPERFIDDAREPMARKGMGVIYTRTASGHPLRRPPSADERQRLLTRFCDPHHAALATAVEAALAARGRCLLIDGHSFPTRPLPYEDDQDSDRPDICIGTDPSHIPAWLRDTAVRTFEDLGWRVAVDRPFSGALVPLPLHQRNRQVHAIMVEVNRRLYMDEESGRPLGCFDDVRERLGRALRTLVSARGSGNVVDSGDAPGGDDERGPK